MKTIKLVLFVLLLLVDSAVASAAGAGRVLVAVGDTTASRDGVTLPLVRGSEVRSGDTLQTGDASNLQVRFSDESIIALRANSVYRIDDYRFDAGAHAGKSLFSLLKGGMRALTGLIGRFQPDNYSVKTKEATIGIRGTNFILALCHNDCFEPDGRQAANGLFGGVVDGRIVIHNQAGAQEFGASEFFQVASATALPKALLVPPSFLRDQLAGQSRSEGAAPPSTGTAAAAETETAPVAEAQTPSPPAVSVAIAPTTAATQPTQTFAPAAQDVVQNNVSGGTIDQGVALGQIYPYLVDLATADTESNLDQVNNAMSAYSFSEAWRVEGKLTIIDPAKLQQDRELFFARMVVDQVPVLTFLSNAYSFKGILDYHPNIAGTHCGFKECIGPVDGSVDLIWDKTASVDTGADALAGNLKWGRYTITSTEKVISGTHAGSIHSQTSYEHWATGDPINLAALPTAGTYSYTWVGGTSPTDQNGAVGTMVSGGTVGVTFTGVGGASVSLTGAAWDMPSGNTYALSFSNQPVAITQTSYANTTSGWQDNGTKASLSQISVPVTCSGSCTGTSMTATVSPMLFGAAAEGLAAGIATAPTNAATNAPSGERTASVQVYRR